MTDSIFIAGLALHAYHGVMDHEAKVGQTFTLDITLDVDLGKASRSDKLAVTIGYDQAVDVASKAFCAKRYRLVEAAAGAVADGQVDREILGLRHAHLVGAHQIIGAHRDRQRRPRRQPRGNLQHRELRVRALVDIVHDPRDHQPRRHRIAQLAGGHALRQLPVEPRVEPGIARILPVTVPTRIGRRDKGQRHLAPRRGIVGLGDQLDGEVVLPGLLRRGGQRDQ